MREHRHERRRGPVAEAFRAVAIVAVFLVVVVKLLNAIS
jgi:hypothetical protein